MPANQSAALTPCDDGLLPAAMRWRESRGRVHSEPGHVFRNPYQRDRDRILHSASFRRLEYKTQVFVNGEGDNYRTRLTHTLEVSQISRTMARELCLNEDLVEAVALSHDLGHTPFGHAGERQLDRLLRHAGLPGFDHNAHGLRVVDLLEKRYAAFPGLNLTYETREAFIRHGAGNCAGCGDFPAGDAPLLEVAATMLADDIAYLAHDLDDGLYSGILIEENLRDLALWRMAGIDQITAYNMLAPSLKRIEGVRRLINLLVSDSIAATRKLIEEMNLDSVEGVRNAGMTGVLFSEKIETLRGELRDYLFANFYRHPNVMTVMEDAQRKLEFLFRAYVSNVEKMPKEYGEIAETCGRDRAVADYIAGMTDRFANEEFSHLWTEAPVR